MATDAEAPAEETAPAETQAPPRSTRRPPATKESTPPQYTTGALKRDPATMAVAVRTNVPDDPYTGHAWAVMTVDRGGHYAPWDEIATWDDVWP
jgi:hypothetical protein